MIPRFFLKKMCFSFGFRRVFAGLFRSFTVLYRYKNERRNKAYCTGKLAALVRDHNHYLKVRYTDAVADYRRAIDNLIYVAKSVGITMKYAIEKDGSITIL